MSLPTSSPPTRCREISPAPGRRPGVRAAVVAVCLAAALLLPACSAQRRYDNPRPGFVERGIASWYGEKFHGRATASGETYDMHALTAAHKELPLGTVVDVKNLDNGRSVRVRINDRGPFARGRIIDLSRAAAREIGMIGPGTARVEIHVLDPRVRLADSPRYTVQVGAFRQRHNAEELRKRLEGDYDLVEVSSVGGLHRVRVGLFAQRSAAEALVAELAARTLEAVVVTLPPNG